MSESQEGIIWYPAGSTTVLEAIVGFTNRMGFKLNDNDKCVANKIIN